MRKSRNLITVCLFALLFGLTAGMAYADEGSTNDVNLDIQNLPVTESPAAGTESLDSAVESNCDSGTAVTEALGMENVLKTENTGSFTWTCGPCSISACANRPVGTSCGFNKWCVVSTTCSTQPLTERCVCGTDHF